MIIVNLTDENFDKTIKNNKGKLLVYWYDNKKKSCQIFENIMVDLNKILPEDTILCKINIKDASITKLKYGITCLPTTVLFKNTEIDRKIAGIRAKYDFLVMLK